MAPYIIVPNCAYSKITPNIKLFVIDKSVVVKLHNYVQSQQLCCVVLLTTVLAKVVSHFKTKFFAQKKIAPFKTSYINKRWCTNIIWW